MDPITILALARGAWTLIETIRGSIKAGKAPLHPDGTPMTEADLDGLRDEIRLELAKGISVAEAELQKLKDKGVN